MYGTSARLGTALLLLFAIASSGFAQHYSARLDFGGRDAASTISGDAVVSSRARGGVAQVEGHIGGRARLFRVQSIMRLTKGGKVNLYRVNGRQEVYLQDTYFDMYNSDGVETEAPTWEQVNQHYERDFTGDVQLFRIPIRALRGLYAGVSVGLVFRYNTNMPFTYDRSGCSMSGSLGIQLLGTVSVGWNLPFTRTEERIQVTLVKGTLHGDLHAQFGGRAWANASLTAEPIRAERVFYSNIPYLHDVAERLTRNIPSVGTRPVTVPLTHRGQRR